MDEKEIIKELYLKLCDASIKKDINTLEEILANDYILIHITGKKQSKKDYIESVLNGELKYYESIHESININIQGIDAVLIGKTKTLASPFGIGKSWWNLKQEILLKKESGKWLIKQSKASSY